MQSTIATEATVFRSALTKQREALMADVTRIDGLIMSIDNIVPAVTNGHGGDSDLSGLSMTDAAAKILRERQPVRNQELVNELARRGRPVGGKKPTATLYGALAKNKDRFKATKKGWTLK